MYKIKNRVDRQRIKDFIASHSTKHPHISPYRENWNINHTYFFFVTFYVCHRRNKCTCMMRNFLCQFRSICPFKSVYFLFILQICKQFIYGMNVTLSSWPFACKGYLNMHWKRRIGDQQFFAILT